MKYHHCFVIAQLYYFSFNTSSIVVFNSSLVISKESSIDSSSLVSAILDSSSFESRSFELKLILFSSSFISITLTVTTSPMLNTSDGLFTWSFDICDTCNNPSTPSFNLTKAPKSKILTTSPSAISPTLTSLINTIHGSSKVCFKPKEILFLSLSSDSTCTSTFCADA